MAVIREQRQFKIGPIGVARASQEQVQIIGKSNLTTRPTNWPICSYREAAQRAEKKGM